MNLAMLKSSSEACFCLGRRFVENPAAAFPEGMCVEGQVLALSGDKLELSLRCMGAWEHGTFQMEAGDRGDSFA